MSSTAALAEVWRDFVANETAGYSALYSAIAGAVAEDEDLLSFVLDTPEASHYPLMLLAAVHDLVLDGRLPALAEVYRGEAPVDSAPALFREAVLDHRDHLADVLATRFVQTNECGRAAPLALALGVVAAEVGRADALVDAGASAGLNLLYDRYRLDFGSAGVLGDPSSPVVCACEVVGAAPAPPELVDVPVRIGLDRAPVDVTDPAAARWLLACTWPDTGRLERTRAAVAVAAASPPDVRTGDLVDGLGPLVAGLDGDGPVVVVTSWAMSYLSGQQRKGFVAALADAGARRRVAWLSLEGPGIIRGIETDVAPPPSIEIGASLIGLTTFAPRRPAAARAIAHVHPHGRVLSWLPTPAS